MVYSITCALFCRSTKVPHCKNPCILEILARQFFVSHFKASLCVCLILHMKFLFLSKHFYLLSSRCELFMSISSTDNHFTQQEISQMLGVSKRTIENRMAEYELTNKSRYTDIGDDFLDSLVQRAMSNFPRSGKGCSFVNFVYYV